MLTGMPSARRCTQASKEKIGKMYDSNKVRSRAAKDRKEEFYDPAREEDISKRNKTRLELWEEHLKDPIVALDKAVKCVESQY